MIYLIPYTTSIIKLPIAPDKLLLGVSAQIRPEGAWLPSFNTHYKFRGEVGEDSFTIRRFTAFGKKGIASCHGQVVATSQGGCELYLTFSIPLLLFLRVLFLPGASFFLFSLSFTGQYNSPFVLTVTALMVLIAAISGLIRFNIDVDLIQKHFQKI